MSHYGNGGGGSGRGDDRYGDSSGYRDSYGSRGGGSSNGALGAGLRTISWDLAKLPVFEKNFYFEHPAVRGRSDGWAEDWRRENNITVIGRGVPKPVSTFEEASMPEYVQREVLKQGFTSRKFVIHIVCCRPERLIIFSDSHSKPRLADGAAWT
jgi:ATP-dependent RNA helicase DDX5/DBP2